jgi:aryl-phospho-beta-D-glucosidase BglC (GH1 family)
MLTALSLASIFVTLPIVWSVPNWNTQPPFSPGFPYGTEPVRGVNLGGWLVLEVRYGPSSLSTHVLNFCRFTQPWITPSLFDNTGNLNIVDEWTFGLYQNPGAALATLTQHWNTWITESDFAAIAAAGYVVQLRFVG